MNEPGVDPENPRRNTEFLRNPGSDKHCDEGPWSWRVSCSVRYVCVV